MVQASDGLTIGQVADLIGVTIKTIRHYHRVGVVPETGRDTSGYRRYSSADVLRLVQARTLAEAGVPLADVPALLDQSGAEFKSSIAELDRELVRDAQRLREQRALLRRLTQGDRALLPDEAVDVLDRLRELGFDDDFIAAQREAMVLTLALAPELLGALTVRLARRLDDPEHVDLLKRAWVAMSWELDDPRLNDLAREFAGNLLANPDDLALPAGFAQTADTNARYQLVNHHRGDAMPAVSRLTELIEQHLRDAGIDVPRR